MLVELTYLPGGFVWGLLQVLHSLLGFASAARAASRAFKDDANQPPSAASTQADASTIDASIVDHSIIRKSRSSPVQRYKRLQPPKRLTRTKSCCLGDAGSGVRISDVREVDAGYTDFLSVDIRISYRWVPSNRVGAFILRSKFHPPIGRWCPMGVNPLRSVLGRRTRVPPRKYCSSTLISARIFLRPVLESLG